MAVLRVQVKDVREEILRAVDGEIVVDNYVIAEIIRGALYHLYRDMGDLVEISGDVEGAQLRSFADRLGRLAVLAEAVA